MVDLATISVAWLDLHKVTSMLKAVLASWLKGTYSWPFGLWLHSFYYLLQGMHSYKSFFVI